MCVSDMRQTNSTNGDSLKEWLQVQVQSEVVLFQGSISRSGLDYAVVYSHVSQCLKVLRSDFSDVLPKWLPVIPLVFGLLGAVFSGWLADAKLGELQSDEIQFCAVVPHKFAF